MPRKPPDQPADRGRKASFDRRTGEVSGSGAGIGNPGSGEDHADDLGIGSGAKGKPKGPSNCA